MIHGKFSGLARPSLWAWSIHTLTWSGALFRYNDQKAKVGFGRIRHHKVLEGSLVVIRFHFQKRGKQHFQKKTKNYAKLSEVIFRNFGKRNRAVLIWKQNFKIKTYKILLEVLPKFYSYLIFQLVKFYALGPGGIEHFLALFEYVCLLSKHGEIGSRSSLQNFLWIYDQQFLLGQQIRVGFGESVGLASGASLSLKTIA